MIRRRLTTIAAMAIVSVLSIHAQAGSGIVDVAIGTTIYQGASTTSGQAPSDVETLLMGALRYGVFPPPFAQPVLQRQKGWLRLPIGWVQEKDTQKAGQNPITNDMIWTVFKGSFGRNETYDMDVDYGVELMETGDNQDKIWVSFRFPDLLLLVEGERNKNVIEAEKGLLIKWAEYEADRTDLSIKLHDERKGIKSFDIYYGERLTTRHVEKFLDEFMTVETLDMKKMNSSDWQFMRQAIAEYGMDVKLYITASTLTQLTPLPEL